MRLQPLVPVFATALACALACGTDATDPGVAGVPPDVAAAPAPPISGTYQVTGTTTEKATGSQRGISGRLIVVEKDGRYTSTFSLTTTLTGRGEPQKAEVIGKGDGTVEGRTLEGTADTQLIVALVPGVDAGFAYMPRAATTRIRNRTVARIDAAGRVQIEIESEPAPGEHAYRPTRTTLRGRRISAAGIGGAAE